MAAVEIWRRYGARATMALDDGLLSITYSGPVTVASWTEVAAIADEGAQGRAVALLADVSRAVIAVSEHQLGGAYPVRTKLTRPDMPGAMVVPVGNLPEFRRLAWALAATGVRRTVFTSLPEAYAWVRALAGWRRPMPLLPCELAQREEQALPQAAPDRVAPCRSSRGHSVAASGP